MRIGACVQPHDIDRFAAYGFDYIEVSVNHLMGLSEFDFEETVRRVEASPIAAEACNILFSGAGEVPLVGERADPAVIREYLRRAFARMARLGAAATAFGSGGLRRCPDGFDPRRAHAQLAQAVIIAGETAAQYGMEVCVEPLNRGETNTVLSLPEGAALVREVGLLNVRLLADFYHMQTENEPMCNLLEVGGMVAHTHIAHAGTRAYPLPAYAEVYAAFFAALGKIGYQGRMSIEGKAAHEEQDAPAALDMLRRLAAEYGI